MISPSDRLGTWSLAENLLRDGGRSLFFRQIAAGIQSARRGGPSRGMCARRGMVGRKRSSSCRQLSPRDGPFYGLRFAAISAARSHRTHRTYRSCYPFVPAVSSRRRYMVINALLTIRVDVDPSPSSSPVCGLCCRPLAVPARRRSKGMKQSRTTALRLGSSLVARKRIGDVPEQQARGGGAEAAMARSSRDLLISEPAHDESTGWLTRARGYVVAQRTRVALEASRRTRQIQRTS